ncbi:MAG: hypothetical protein HC919_02510 [Oscillatoriales cyanobacterium SM2_2_1]|nr:hypothetical protein [Oscillatoriales cyanobacterium SM2_2_1]
MSRITTKSCDVCRASCSVCYRVQYQASDRVVGAWYLVCPGCQLTLSDRNPHYRYGGTWKAKR